MIAASSTSDQQHTSLAALPRPRWQQALADAIRDPHELCRVLDLDPRLIADAMRASREFPLLVPRSFAAKIRRADPHDPLLLQVLPSASELRLTPGYGVDPVGDLASRASQGLLHKYQGRALLIATGACAVHCRYCFRRHFPYSAESALAGGWEAALDHLRRDSSIGEVILSGGDPLSLSDRRLEQLSAGIESIPHVRRLRIHTRYPIVLPERIDHDFLQWLRHVKLQKIVVIHANHARELDGATRQACLEVRAAGATLLNQSVLLAGINANVDTLAQLSEALFASGVLPYYLHLLDRVQGAAQFEVSERDALALHTELSAKLPGYLVPKLVREVPGAVAKTPVTP